VVGGHSPVATFLVDSPLTAGARVTLEAAAAHHARVRRLAPGESLRLTDGRGVQAIGTLARLSKSALDVDVESVDHVSAPPALHLLVPIGDRDRMLWLGEKATELGVTTWQSVRFERSRSVSPRGEGDAFRKKLHARMAGALEQSHGTWLPEILAEIDAAPAAATHESATRLILDAQGSPVLAMTLRAPVAMVLGPEGGITPNERQLFVASGWLPASLGRTTLRFETAAIAATAVVRASLEATTEG
jgi:16S rRNA (uracil1498-N3)-methyltransferase